MHWPWIDEWRGCSPGFNFSQPVRGLTCSFLPGHPAGDPLPEFIGPGMLTTPGQVVSSSEIRCTSPPYSVPGRALFSISFNGRDLHHLAEPFVYYSIPVVTVAVPAGSPAVGGGEVIVHGKGFRGGQSPTTIFCSFDGLRSQAVVNSTADRQIVCIAPPHAPAIVLLQVSLNGQDFGGRAAFYTYYDSPNLTSVVPTGGVPSRDPALAPTVTISGSGFLGFSEAPTCRFGCALSQARILSNTHFACEVRDPIPAPASRRGDTYVTLLCCRFHGLCKNGIFSLKGVARIG